MPIRRRARTTHPRTAIAIGALVITAIAGAALPAAAQPQSSTASEAVSASRLLAAAEPVMVRSTVSDLATAGDYACGIKPGGTVECWGDDTGGKATPPSDVLFSQLSSAPSYSCGIVTSTGDTSFSFGAVRCWGAGTPLPIPAFPTFTQIVTAAGYACGIYNFGSLTCWGSGIVSLPAGSYSTIALSAHHACGLSLSGQLVCAGDDAYGRVSGPNAATGTFRDVAIGADHSCAIRNDSPSSGALVCWGRSDAIANVPSGQFQTLAATDAGSCAITVLYTASCWGGLTAPIGGYRSLHASAAGICAITNAPSYATCWNGPEITATLPTSGGTPVIPSVQLGTAVDIALPISHVSPTPTWQVTGLPAGLSVVNGRIVGTPTATADATIRVLTGNTVMPFDQEYRLAVTGGAATQLVVEVGTTGRVQGGAATVQVTALDAFGNAVGTPDDYSLASDVAVDSFPDTTTVEFGFDASDVPTIAATHRITATSGSLTGYTDVSVAPLVTQLRLTLDPATLEVHTVADVRVDGLDAAGAAVVDLTSESTLVSSVALDAAGTGSVSPATVGSRTITAGYRTLTTTAALTGVPGALASVVVVSSSTTVDTDATVTVSVEGFDAYGNTVGDVTDQAAITSSVAGDEIDGDQVTFAFDPAAQVTTEVVHTLTATVGSVSNSTQVTVAPLVDTLELQISPTANVGDTIVAVVIGLDANGDPVGDLSAYVTVTSDQPGDVVTGNTVTFTHASPHLITARYGTLAASATVEVSPSATALGDSGIDLTPLTLGLGLLGLGVLIGGLRLRARRG